MDQEEFQSRLELFPVVRSPDYHVDSDPSKQSTSSRRRPQLKEKHEEWQDTWEEEQGDEEDHGVDLHDPFWEKLKLAAEKKVGAAEAKRFCKAFQQVHRKLVYEELSLDAGRRYLKS